ncbi:hypothetical protein A8C56_04770 [Niabella ginsenosidivorans]|uniref:AAA+ ATPase domain-containing protein n=1 Tax=Niabella ginsenosidivorans TaxID=1176587 RepID=A0A1A9HZ80_9BACT|nr:ATP-binding protein [Niabella ginsenosidivorans]ANH80385.1 hypothetical protein A8C56_04770 [Niabella ginsenosidivorans]
MDPSIQEWSSVNQQFLAAMVAIVRKRLEVYDQNGNADAERKQEAALLPLQKKAAVLLNGMTIPAALNRLGDTFGLSEFEKNVLLLCAGVELDPEFGGLVSKIQGGGVYPTFGLALAVLPDAHWSAVVPGGSLRYWRFIELTGHLPVTKAPLKIDEHILHYLAGIYQVDERLLTFVQPFRTAQDMVPSHAALCDLILNNLTAAAPDNRLPVLQLGGAYDSDKKEMAAQLCRQLGVQPYSASLYALPSGYTEIEDFARLWNRESALKLYALIIDATNLDPSDKHREQILNQYIVAVQSPLIILGGKTINNRVHSGRFFEIPKPLAEEQYHLWKKHLNGSVALPDQELRRLVSQFDFNAKTIEQTVTGFTAIPVNGKDNRLWHACCHQVRPEIEELAQRIPPLAEMDDLILPESQKERLRELILQVKHRSKVYDEWGFGRNSNRGLGITALFAGESGTGKTMASEVIAKALDLDLYRVDLSQVVNKYIGETEKNLKKIFDAAEQGGAVLLFDEADALFGKRSEVKDSHDRYANVEVSYLLQRMEAYKGLAILTTNMKQAMDRALMRRIRFVVQFPFPGAEQRAAIWKRVFPRETPIASLDISKLARLNIAGGSIKNVAMNAAFIAAETGGPVTMMHIQRALRGEYEKMEKPLSHAEINQLQ